MEDRPDLERYVEEETRRLLDQQSRFLGWPTHVRVLAALAVATAQLAFCSLVIAGLTLAGRDGTPGTAAVVTFAIGALVLYPVAVRRAMDPEGSTRRSVRTLGAYPTRAPGYRTKPVDRDDRA